MAEILKPKNSHHPVEVFGYPIDISTQEAKQNRAKYWCPFMNKKCDKQSRMLSYPMGVCSVLHMGNSIPICPHRFLQDNTVFIDICDEFLGGTNNILLFKEIGLAAVGTFDFVLVKHKPISNKVEDFCVVELQSDSTTNTGKLVNALKDFLNGEDVSEIRYKYGMNTYNTIKLAYTQILYKGQALEKWQKKIVWVCPTYIFQNTVKRFNLTNLGYNPQCSTSFFVYDSLRQRDAYHLKLVDKSSSTIDNLLTAFTKQPTPKLDNFIALLENKINLHLGITLS